VREVDLLSCRPGLADKSPPLRDDQRRAGAMALDAILRLASENLPAPPIIEEIKQKDKSQAFRTHKNHATLRESYTAEERAPNAKLLLKKLFSFKDINSEAA
jgi:hypothetical protein